MFRRLAPATDILDDIAFVESIVRERFQIEKKEIILVSEDRCSKLGFPPYETNITFWKDRARYRHKIFLRICDVTQKDVPVEWLLPSLEDTGEGDCC